MKEYEPFYRHLIILPHCSHAHESPPDSLHYTAREVVWEMLGVPGIILKIKNMVVTG